MPVISQSHHWPASRDRSALVRRLADELGGSSTPGGPVIFELTHEAIVLWDEWDGIPNPDRASIIREAYSMSEGIGHPGAPQKDRFSVVFGFTVEEAIEHDLLPYHVMSSIPPGHQDREKVERAMLERGAIQVRGRVELRLPTMALAREARDRLVKRFPDHPDIHFQIAQTVRFVDQSSS